jgi:hypothetical protein
VTRQFFRYLLIVTVVGAMPTAAQPRPDTVGSSASAFRYRPERIDVGTVYHYLKTNLDGSNATKVTIYLSARSRVEVLKAYPATPYLYYVTADLDWSAFEAVHLVQWALHPDGRRTLQLSGVEDPNGTEFVLRTASASPPNSPPPVRIVIGYHPFHVYSFDLISLNLALRHLANPEGEFRIGLIVARAASAVSYSGEATVRFVRNERRHDVECRVYEVDGDGLARTKGTIWVNRERGHVEDLEFALPDTPGWKSFKFELQSIDRMDDFQWNDWVVEQARSLH